MKTLTLLLILSVNVIASSNTCRVYLESGISYEEREIGVSLADYSNLFIKNGFEVSRIEEGADIAVSVDFGNVQRCYEGKGPGKLESWVIDNLSRNYFIYLGVSSITGGFESQVFGKGTIKMPSKKKYLSKVEKMIKKLKCN